MGNLKGNLKKKLFTIASKRIKYLEINLINDVEEWLTELQSSAEKKF